MRVLTLFLYLLLPFSALASEQVSVGNIRMHMRSSTNSNPEDFPIRVLSQTFLFLEQVFKNVYSDKFERLSLSINSRGIEEDENGGFIVAVDIAGTSYFTTATVITPQDITDVLKDSFRKYNDLFLDILAESIDPFLADISYAIVIVDGDSVVNTVIPETKENDDDDGLKVWAIASIAAGAGFFTILCLCSCFIFCCADPDEEPYKIPEVTKSGSNTSKKTKNTSASSKEEEEADEEESTLFTNGHLETRSITSQDSSRFTYNPKSVRSHDCGGTFASFATNTSNMEHDLESWQRASTIHQGGTTAFGDISAIESKKDLSHIVEKDEESGASSHDLSTLKGLHIREEDEQRREALGGGRRSLDLSGAAQDVIEDLNDLSRQVAMYRKSVP